LTIFFLFYQIIKRSLGMKKFFTKMSLVGAFALCFTAMNAQVIWPTADSATIRASQFADTTQIFWQKTGGPAPAANFTGWVTKGVTVSGSATKDSARWVWRADASASGGVYWGTQTAIGSPSRLNGAAVFNSDYLDAIGITAPHSGELISPKMNLAGYRGLSVQVNQSYRNFQSQAQVSYSSDDGVTWSTPINMNSDIGTNVRTLNPVIKTNTDSTLKTIKLIGSVGSANFRIKFIFDGNYYFWILDDIKIIPSVDYDVQMTPFYAIPPSLYTPKDQMEPIRFGASIRNVGNKPMPNVKLAVNVWNSATGANVFSATTAAGQYPATMIADTLLEKRVLPTSLNARNLAPGVYVGSYRVLGDSSSRDAVPANDTARFAFVVSDTSAALNVAVTGIGRSNYTKENSIQVLTRNADSYWGATEAKTWRVGNYYRIQKGKSSTITSIIANVNPAAVAGRTLLGALYQWNDVNSNSVVEATERTLVAYAEVPVAAGATGSTWYIFNLVDLITSKPFIPKDSTGYLAMVEFDPGAPAATPVYPTAAFCQVYDYQGMDYVDTLGRYTIVTGKNGTTDWSLGGYSDGAGGKAKLVPGVRINVAPFVVDVKDILSDDNKMTIYPNPSGSVSVITADVELTKATPAVIDIMTIDGKTVAEQIVDNMQKTKVEIDISGYAAGMYIFKLTTPNGIMTRRFVVAK
jgi:hypothetical protein